MKRRTKIFIITECPYSGILRAIIENSRILKHMGFQLSYILPDQDRDRYGETAISNCAHLLEYGNVYRTPMRKKYSAIASDSKKLLAIINDESSLVFSYGSYAGKLARRLFKSGKIRNLYHVAQCIDFARMNWRNKMIEKAFERRLNGCVSYYLSCSPTEAYFLNSYLNIPASKIVTLPNAIKPKEKIPQKEKVYDFIIVSRLVASKRIDDVLRVAMTVNLDNRFVVLGDGPELNKLKNKYPAVKFLGHVSSKMVESHSLKSRFIVSNSIIEGLPFGIIEAMSLGIVPILSNVDGHRDLIVDSYNGFAFSNDKELGCLMLKATLLDDNYYKQMSRNTRDFSKRLYVNNERILTSHFNRYE